MLFNMFIGNFDKWGGMMFIQLVVDVLFVLGKGSMGGFIFCVRGFLVFVGEYLVVCLVEEILILGEG